ncbi:DUF2911 domain-containing protein [uncultured Polaribacter sp.]|uniref:DUF2911 domain-containing protein n=1 Tax=uncultured Polaribacter sp. TaxID=174711 RepID=UPI00260E43B6|nr:DUF2911 domain-containing protein [uncultured Polaribacter sp.]
MKNLLLITSLFIFLIFPSTDILAQKFPRLDISPMDAATYPIDWKNSDKLVKIIYGRPQLKGRSLSDLASVSKKGVWRTGANEATEITFFKNVLFGGIEVKAGTYTLFTIPTENEWTFILSSVRNVWGHYTYDQKNDVLRVAAKVSESKKIIEALSIAFEENNDNKVTMFLGWANVIVSLDIEEIIEK